jgi:hypothetical protein
VWLVGRDVLPLQLQFGEAVEEKVGLGGSDPRVPLCLFDRLETLVLAEADVLHLNAVDILLVNERLEPSVFEFHFYFEAWPKVTPPAEPQENIEASTCPRITLHEVRFIQRQR